MSVFAFDRHREHFQTLAGINTPNPARRIGVALVVLMVLLALFLAYVPWIQTSRGSGVVNALKPSDRMQELNALVSGRIAEWYVQDGSRVKANDPIVRIIDNDPQLLERLENERDQVEAKLDAARKSLALAERDNVRMLELFEQGLASRREYEQASLQVETLRTTVADTQAELARIQVNLSRQSMQVVRAPRDGVVLRVYASDIATVISAGTPIASFMPTDVERVVELFIPGRDVPLIREGARVRLQFDGWPVLQISGWPSKAVGTFAGEVLSVDPTANERGEFRVLVGEDDEAGEPWPDFRFVRLGSRAIGWILMEEVTVGYEIWRQLNSFPPKYPNDGSGSNPWGGN